MATLKADYSSNVMNALVAYREKFGHHVPSRVTFVADPQDAVKTIMHWVNKGEPNPRWKEDSENPFPKPGDQVSRA